MPDTRKIIEIPKIKTDVSGYEFFTRLWSDYQNIYDKHLVIDFSLCDFFDANMTAPLGLMLRRFELQGNSLEFKHLSEPINDILSRNNFLAFFNQATKVDDAKKTVIHYKEFLLGQDKCFAQYCYDEFEGNKNIESNIPKMSESLRNIFYTNIIELYNNSSIHSESHEAGISSCGQLFPTYNKIVFTICDLGIGFKERIKKTHNFDFDSCEAIKWAVKENKTTKLLKDGIPGSHGLKILIEFIKKNDDSLDIISDTGYWQLRNNVSTQILKFKFPGTITSITIKTNDTKKYSLSNEVKEKNSEYFQ